MRNQSKPTFLNPTLIDCAGRIEEYEDNGIKRAYQKRVASEEEKVKVISVEREGQTKDC